MSDAQKRATARAELVLYLTFNTRVAEVLREHHAVPVFDEQNAPRNAEAQIISEVIGNLLSGDDGDDVVAQALDIFRAWPGRADPQTRQIFVQLFRAPEPWQNQRLLWEQMQIFMHEILHVAEHRAYRRYRELLGFRSYARNVAEEGAVDFLLHIAWSGVPFRDPQVREEVEGEYATLDPLPLDQMPHPAEREYASIAEVRRLAQVAGDWRNVPAAFFLGDVEKIAGRITTVVLGSPRAPLPAGELAALVARLNTVPGDERWRQRYAVYTNAAPAQIELLLAQPGAEFVSVWTAAGRYVRSAPDAPGSAPQLPGGPAEPGAPELGPGGESAAPDPGSGELVSASGGTPEVSDGVPEERAGQAAVRVGGRVVRFEGFDAPGAGRAVQMQTPAAYLARSQREAAEAAFLHLAGNPGGHLDAGQQRQQLVSLLLGPPHDDDPFRRAALVLLRAADDQVLSELFGDGDGDALQDFLSARIADGDSRRGELNDFIESRFRGGRAALAAGTVELAGQPLRMFSPEFIDGRLESLGLVGTHSEREVQQVIAVMSSADAGQVIGQVRLLPLAERSRAARWLIRAHAEILLRASLHGSDDAMRILEKVVTSLSEDAAYQELMALRELIWPQETREGIPGLPFVAGDMCFGDAFMLGLRIDPGELVWFYNGHRSSSTAEWPEVDHLRDLGWARWRADSRGDRALAGDEVASRLVDLSARLGVDIFTSFPHALAGIGEGGGLRPGGLGLRRPSRGCSTSCCGATIRARSGFDTGPGRFGPFAPSDDALRSARRGDPVRAGRRGAAAPRWPPTLRDYGRPVWVTPVCAVVELTKRPGHRSRLADARWVSWLQVMPGPVRAEAPPWYETSSGMFETRPGDADHCAEA